MEDKKKKVVLQELAASPTPSRARSRRTALLVVQGLQTAPGVPVRWSPPPPTPAGRHRCGDRTAIGRGAMVGHVEVEEAQSDPWSAPRSLKKQWSSLVRWVFLVGLASLAHHAFE